MLRSIVFDWSQLDPAPKPIPSVGISPLDPPVCAPAVATFVWTTQVEAYILRRLEEGLGLVAIVREARIFDPEFPSRASILRHCEANPDFDKAYSLAKDKGIDYMAEETLTIAKDGTNDYVMASGQIRIDKDHILRSRLRIDTTKWYVSKIAPNRYSDRIASPETVAGKLDELVALFKQGPVMPEAKDNE